MLKTLKRIPKALALLIPLTMVLGLGLFFAPAPAYADFQFTVPGGTSPQATLQGAIDEIVDNGTPGTAYTITVTADYDYATQVDFEEPVGPTPGFVIKIKSDNTVRTLTMTGSDRHIWVADGNTLTLENIILESNGGTSTGGGIDVDLGGTLNLNDGAVIKDCTGTGTGGGVSLTNATLNLEDGSMIQGCYAIDTGAGSGGGVYGAAVSEVIMNDGAVIRDCVASPDDEGHGGGIYLNDSANELEIAGGSILNNTGSLDKNSTGYAGGVRIGDNNIFTMSGGEIIGNLASKGDAGQGGGVYINDATTATMTGGTIGFNLASEREDGAGGGVYTEADFEIKGGIILTNTASKGDGGLGGGIFAEDGAAAAITLSGIPAKPCNIIGNDASGDGGGGIYLEGDSSLTTTGHVEFSKNLAVNGDGGAIYTEDDTNYANITTSAATLFKNNGADKAYMYDGTTPDVPGILFGSTSIHFPGSFGIEDYDHVLNNFDINFTAGDEFDPFIYIYLDVLEEGTDALEGVGVLEGVG
ncbi:MAG: hypothetical protein FWG14_07500 [Peptococcaceae bacterium]|nr:hypothetical protein [Peptococcaceae bacterium]